MNHATRRLSDTRILLSGLQHDAIRLEPFREILEAGARFRRAVIDCPHITLGISSCSIERNAREIENVISNSSPVKNGECVFVRTSCAGLCDFGPIVSVALPGRTALWYGNVSDPETANEIINGVLSGGVPRRDILLGQYWSDPNHNPYTGIGDLSDHPFFRGQKRNILSRCGFCDPSSPGDYMSRGGFRSLASALHTMTPHELCDNIILSGLAGRGGGAFPAGIKWKSVLESASDRKYLICNADEGDPDSVAGKTLLEGDPFSIIEGVALAAYASGASSAFICLRNENTLAVERIEHALESASELGLAGENILDSGFNLNIMIRRGAGAFVCGEETALIRTLEGHRGTPYPRPPYPVERGLFGKPTAVNDIETLANVPYIIRSGAENYRSEGTSFSSGSKLVTLSDSERIRGVLEFPFGTKLSSIVSKYDIFSDSKIKALHTGGPTGSTIPESEFDYPFCYKIFRELDNTIGSGSIKVLTENNCIIHEIRRCLEFIMNESCGKCAPCREGSVILYDLVRSLERPHDPAKSFGAMARFKAFLKLEPTAKTVRNTSLCGLGRGGAAMLLGAMKKFHGEFEEHLFERRCAVEKERSDV